MSFPPLWNQWELWTVGGGKANARGCNNHPSMRDVGWLGGVIALTVDAEGSRSRNPHEHHPNQPQLSTVSNICEISRELNVEPSFWSFIFIIAYI